ncbi:hypothetical protein [Vreelandella titanicae]|uniref:hypothetical protein n=1 Tax=Vreelandella titanicae TaxID=664683 RepID=UPI00382172EF
MSKIAKLHRNSVDDLLEEVGDLDLSECVVVGKTKDGDRIAYYCDNTSRETLAVTALMLQHDATCLIVNKD